MKTNTDALRLIVEAHNIANDAIVKKHLATAARSELATLLYTRKVIDISEPNQHEIDLFHSRGKLDAVKAHKNRTGMSLMESKRKIEAACGY